MNCFPICKKPSFLLIYGSLLFVPLLVCLESKSADSPQNSTSTPKFESGFELTSDSGYIRLAWSHPDYEEIPAHIKFELQQSETKDFDKILLKYQGPDTASYISGLPNGTYYYRIRTSNTETGQTSPWSETVTLHVQHHSIQLAIALMVVGALVFITTVSVIIHGTMSMKANSQQS